MNVNAVYHWLNDQGESGDRELIAALRKIWKESDTLIDSEIPRVPGLSKAQHQRLGEALEATEKSAILMELTRAGWHPDKTENYPNDQVIITWQARDSPALDAGSTTREIAGNDLLDAYRNAKRELLG